MATRIHTGGRKEFVYNGNENYEDTEPTKQFKKDYHRWKSQPKWKRKLFRYKSSKKAKVFYEHREQPPKVKDNYQKESVSRLPEEKIKVTQPKQKRNFPIAPFIYFAILFIIALFIANGIIKLINSESFDKAIDKVSSIKQKLLPIKGKTDNNIEEGIVLPGDIVKEEPPLIIDEKTFERKEEAKQAFEYSVNELRREKEILEMEWSDNAYNLAMFRAKDLYERDYYEHVTPEGLTVSDYLEEFNIAGYARENIGGMAHYPNEEISGNVRQVVRQWMVSVGHKQNLMDRDHDIGAIGCYKYICVFIGVSGGEVEEEVIEIEEELEEETVPIPRGYYASSYSCNTFQNIASIFGQGMDMTAQNECLSVCGNEDKAYANKYKCDSEGRFLCKCY